MIRTVRFLWRFSWPNWCILGSAVLVILAGALWTGVPEGRDNLFSSYFMVFPMLIPMMLMVFSFALCATFLDIALSFGARRRDFLLALQGILLLDVLVGCGLAWGMAAVPQAMHWASDNQVFSVHAFLSWAGGLYPLIIFGETALGCAAGLLMARSKVLGTVLVLFSTLVSMGFFILNVFGALTQPPGWLWTAAAALCTAIAAGSEAVLWRNIRRRSVV